MLFLRLRDDITGFIYNIPYFKKLDIHRLEAVQGTSVAFLLKILSSVLGLVTSIIVARLIGAGGVGIIALSSIIISAASTAGRFGLDNSLVRFVGEYASRNDWNRVAGVYSLSVRTCTLSLLLVAGFIMVAAEPLAEHVFHKPGLALPLRLMALGMVPTGIVFIRGEVLRGLKRIRESISLQLILPQIFSLPLVVVLAYLWGVTGAVVGTVIGSVIVLVYSFSIWNTAVPQIAAIRGEFDRAKLFRSSFPLLLVSMMHMIMASADTAILGIFNGSESVGIYSIALKIGSLTNFILLAINTIAAPKFAALYGQGDVLALEDLGRYFTKMGIVVALPIFLVIILAGRMILGFFGSEFTGAYSVLLILAAAQMANVSFGSVGYLLAMTGHEIVVRNITMISAVSNIGLNFILIPVYGITGAAAASAVSIVLFNILGVVMVYRKLSILTIPIPRRYVKNAD
ncbi:MAG TPA: flippase [Thermodesulfobacteriaceae bacterium]|nr:flippase [Thermodesulfobacteriaceae bacterium]